MRRRAGWAMVAGALAMIVPAASRADDKATRDAQARFEEGIGRVKAGDFEAARASFAQAYAVLHKPDILWNLALSEQKSGHIVDALGHFKQLARDATSDGDRENAKKHVSELMAQTGHIEVLAPEGAKVSVDGAAAGVAPLVEPVDVLPGRHHLEARLPQGTKTAEADTIAGQVAHVSFTVVAAPAPAQAGPGQTGAGEPGAGLSGSAGAGGNESTAAAMGGGSVAQDTTAPQTGASAGPARTITVIAIGGLAVASGALGVAFAVGSNNNANTAAGFRSQYPNNYCSNPANAQGSTCTQWNDAVRSQNQDASLSTGFYVAGGVLAAGAIATWFLWPKKAQDGVKVLPSVGPTGAGLTTTGTF